uniref:Uncharacterized protein n=1 Tax=Anopheles epiroticus TaxID=199890 RepID=A0A182P445_9DIPT
MVTQRMSPEHIETFVHEHLKEDLRVYENQLKDINAEIMEYVQLKNMIDTILGRENHEEFKTQVNIGGNMFMKARAESVDHILVDVGLKVYATLSGFIQFKTSDEIFRKDSQAEAKIN